MKPHTHPPFRAPRYETGCIYGHLEILDNGAAEECHTRRVLRVRCVVCGRERESKEESVDVCVRRRARGCSKCGPRKKGAEETDRRVLAAIIAGARSRSEVDRAIGRSVAITTLTRALGRLVSEGAIVRSYGSRGAVYAPAS